LTTLAVLEPAGGSRELLAALREDVA
jgi:hypothetical protein